MSIAYRILKSRVRAKYGDLCKCCGRTEPECKIVLDHVFGVKKTLGLPAAGSALWRWADHHILDPRLRLLCNDCNADRSPTGWCRRHER